MVSGCWLLAFSCVGGIRVGHRLRKMRSIVKVITVLLDDYQLYMLVSINYTKINENN